MTFERTQDWELVKRIVTHPKIYPYVGDDFSVDPSLWEPEKNEAIWYLAVKDEGTIIGLFVYFPENYVCWHVHVCLLPIAWGRKAILAFCECIRWVFQNTPCERIVGSVPMWNFPAARLARNAGMTEFGINKASHLKKKRLHDQILFGISKRDIAWES